MLSGLLLSLSAAVVLTLGTVHLVYTFWGTKLTPRDPAVRTAMIAAHPVLTRRTTMWRAWIGFNASHALGAILFGLLYGYLALAQPALLFRSPYLLAVGLGVLAAYLLLAKLYWFRIPFVGILIAFVWYLAGVAAALLGSTT
jgi:hypothetical protein